MKAGVELTLNTVIIAALLLVTMVVIIAILFGGVGSIREVINRVIHGTDAQSQCIPSTTADDPDGDGWSNSKQFKVGDTSGPCDACPADPKNHEADKCAS